MSLFKTMMPKVWISAQTPLRCTVNSRDLLSDREGMNEESLLLQAGQSDALMAVFETVATADVYGEPKFSRQVSHDLARLIACRTYATPVMELCHLVNIAAALDPGGARWEPFFWDSGPARSGAFKGYMDQARQDQGMLADRLKPLKGGVEITYQDGSSFTVMFGRMPLLSALLEFLLATPLMGEAFETFNDMTSGPCSRDFVSDIANKLSRSIYHYLKDHLPTVQNQKKYRKMSGFLGEVRAEGPADIDDALVLDFWVNQSTQAEDVDTEAEFRMFGTVVQSFIRMVQALEAAQDSMGLANMRQIGHDREAGEIDPNLISEALESIDERTNPLNAFAEPPTDRIKFLNKAETATLELTMEAGPVALRLPLSVVRADVFARHQARLTQGLRRKLSPHEMQALIHDLDDLDYEAHLTALETLEAHLEKTTLASLYALVRAREEQAVTLILHMAPEADLGPLAHHLSLAHGQDEEDEEDAGNVVPLGGKVTDRFLDVLQDPLRAGEDLAALVGDAQKAHKGLARSGFKEDPAEDRDLARGFALGATPLLTLKRELEAFRERLSNLALPENTWPAQFGADRATFLKQFTLLYGGAA